MPILRNPVGPPPLQSSPINLVRSSRLPVDETNGRWIDGFAFLPLPDIMPWTDDPCTSRASDVPQLPLPQGVSAVITSTSSGALTGTQDYAITALNVNGETMASQHATVTFNTGVTGTARVSWTTDPSAAGYNVYGDRGSGAYGLLAQNVQAGSWVDDGSVAKGGAPPTANTTGGPGYYANPALVEYVPPIARLWDRCSVLGFEMNYYVERAQAALEATTPTAVEFEAWAGWQAQRSGWPNPYFADSNCTVVTPTTVPSIQRAVELLEQSLAGCGGGTRGMIHLRPEAVPHLTQVRRDGNLMLTANDTIVVPGNGYPNVGPGGTPSAPSGAPAGQTWLYATGLIDVRISDIYIWPDPSDPNWLVQAMNKDINEVIVRAERFISAVWDRQCQFATLATLDT